jgi:lipopolysaccharide biosynthesis glycosyltransferase
LDNKMKALVYIGWDPREVEAYDVCKFSIERRSSADITVKPIILEDLRRARVYYRPTEIRDGRLWDVISEAPMSTEFAISRFFVPMLAKQDDPTIDFALFCDCDFLWLGDVAELLASADQAKALSCVEHQYVPSEQVKMDGQVQLKYHRKNWSSLMLLNLRHPSHSRLTTELLNSVPGRDLHRFCWLEDEEIGAIPQTWNWLEGTTARTDDPPKAVHFTRGGPWMDDWKTVDYANLWLEERARLIDRTIL